MVQCHLLEYGFETCHIGGAIIKKPAFMVGFLICESPSAIMLKGYFYAIGDITITRFRWFQTRFLCRKGSKKSFYEKYYEMNFCEEQ